MSTVSAEDRALAVACRCTANMKICSLLIQTKAEMNLPVTTEDSDRISSAVAEVKSLDYNSHSAISIEIERLTSEGKFEEAKDLSDSAISRFPDDIIIKLHGINVKTQMAFTMLQQCSKEEVMAILMEIEEDYKELLKVEAESTNVDIICQYAQFLSLTGKFQENKDILDIALTRVRTKEELRLVISMYDVSLAQIKAIDQYRVYAVAGLAK